MKRKVQTSERSKLQLWSSIARSVLDNVRSRKMLLNLNDSHVHLRESECIRAVSESICESPVRNLLLNCMLDAERKSPGASYVTLCDISNDVTCDMSSGRRFSISDLLKGLNKIIGNECADIVIDSISLAGRKGKIILDPNHSQLTEISYGSQICKWKPSTSYFSSLNQSKVSVQNCKVVFIDGIIESVSECHRLFQDSYDKKTPVVLFARGFAEEVDATAAVNMQRQTAQVIPILVPFDEVGVNGMADIASCFSSELVSSDKGQLISNIKIESLPTVERITCSHLGTEIENKNSRTDHVIKALTSRLKNDDQNQLDLIRRRLDALGSGSVTIKIGDESKSSRGIYRDRIDFGIRYVRSCMAHGVLDFENLLLPSQSIKTGIECSKSFKKILQSSRVTLEVDRCG